MPRRYPEILASLWLVLVCSSVSPAQSPPPILAQPPPPVLAEDPTQDVGDVQLNADLVLVSAVVTKGADGNKLVRNLSAADFMVLDNGVRQDLAFFGDEGLPLDVVFLIDASQSVRLR